MTTIKGIGRKSKRYADGIVKYSYYTSRQPGSLRFWGPTENKIDLMPGNPLPPEFVEAYVEAVKAQREDERAMKGDLERFIDDYLEGPKFSGLSPATQANYRMHAKTVRAAFGTASIAVLEHRRFKGKIITWHHQKGKTAAKSADDALTVLYNVLEQACRRGELMVNRAEKIDRLYVRPDDKRPVTRDEFEKLLKKVTQDRKDIATVAWFTGLRAKDLAELTWNAVKGSYIEHQTSKSRYNKTVHLPLTQDAQSALESIRQRQLGSRLGLQRTVLVGAKGRSMKSGSVSRKINEAFDKLGIDKTLHNFRNSYATVLVRAEFTEEEIATTLGWSLEDVRELIRIYVRPEEINAAKVAKLLRRGQ